jgi:predicted NBD/HSP70 family sugar kinase
MGLIDNRKSRAVGNPSNSLAVFTEVLFKPSVLRSDIARRTNLTPASVSRITRQLIDAGLIEEFEQKKTGRPGRAHVNLRLCEDAGYVVGISVNAFEQRIAIANLQRQLLVEESLPRDPMLNPATAADVAVEHAQAILKRHRIPRNKVLCVGVATAGVVDAERRRVIRAPTIGWNDVPFGQQIEKKLGIPVRMDNQVTALAAAEYRFGDGMRYRDFITVHATLGIGMGIVSDGRPVRGHEHHAGWIGQIPVQVKEQSDKDIVRLDDVAGGAAMYAKWSGRPPLNPREVSEPMMRELISAANSGDTSAIAICQNGARQLGRVVATIATALGSAAIMLVGPLVKVDSYRECLEDVLRSSLRKEINITVSNRRGIEAACMLAISELAMDDFYLKRLMA